eukprot:CAMPEP_0174877834 /NCGR_PEP_ID=MMETSP1114-20130205/82457_1 /TAXON_ID=312471 /ORGANISM="Neobodo designis, Strain CCAP 1951/1" /LENGTH=202 /DNA_ID=CAMNT_0016113221 /DNA_START=284 /DNA_END=892 /DNA_ORIENTATION=-
MTRSANNKHVGAPRVAIAVMGATADGAEHKPILAQRFRTKMCKNHVERGECPYVHRCMFAHGESELRTTEQNVADRLFSEDAIRAFKCAHYKRQLKAEKLTAAALAASAALIAATAAEPIPTGATPISAPFIGTAAAITTVSPMRTPARRHDPYATKSAWHPLGPRSRLSASTPDAASNYAGASDCLSLSGDSSSMPIAQRM